jgi:hypothetical protein
MNLIQTNTETVNTEKSEICQNVLTQTKAHSSRTDKYTVVSTGDVISQLEAAGFECKKVQEERNTAKYKGFGTHLIRCVHPGITMGNDELNRELTPQLYIKNSYHGRTRFEIHMGLFRTFCLNGLILGNQFKATKVKHIGLTKDDVDNLVAEMSRVYKEEVAPYILALKEVKMTREQQIEFAETALRERMRNNLEFIQGEHELLLTYHRPQDQGDSLWEILQRVQENLGLNFRGVQVDVTYQYNSTDKDNNPVIKERKVSKLTNIKEVTYLNKFLFDKITEYLPADKQSRIAA